MRRTFILFVTLSASIGITACESSSPTTSPSGARPGEVKTLVDVTTGLDVTAGGTGTWNYAGQSFVVPESGGFNNIRFHWYTFQKTPVAFGVLFLLTQEYLGLPRDLGPSTLGFVARSDHLAHNVYLFAQDVSINGGTKYWVYIDAQGSFAGSFDQDIYPTVCSCRRRRASSSTRTSSSRRARSRNVEIISPRRHRDPRSFFWLEKVFSRKDSLWTSAPLW